jgi:tRNA threonylcarbamoyladenosine biosynthesis protein TsaE
MAKLPPLIMESAMSAPLPNPEGPTSHSTKASENDAQVEAPPPLAGAGTNDRSAHLSFLLADENATLALAGRLAAQLQPGIVIYLHGDLGAGKTCLVRGILNALGYTGRVKSPTYTLLEPYHIAGLDLRHFDLYRLQHENEWESAGFRDEFDGNNVIFIEWPEKAHIPPADLVINLEILPPGRCAVIKGNTSMGRTCLKQL